MHLLSMRVLHFSFLSLSLMMMLVFVLFWLLVWVETTPAAVGTAASSSSSGAGAKKKKKNKRSNKKVSLCGNGSDDDEEVESEEQLLLRQQQRKPASTAFHDSLDGLSAKSIAGDGSSARSSLSQQNGDDSECGSENVDETDENNDADYFSSESDEEESNSYKPGGYHPVQAGQVYKSRFQVLEKLGWGHFSTVWKCLDKDTGEIVAMKVQKSARHYTEAARDEIELLECTVKAAKQENTIDSIKVVRLIDSFDHVGPHGVRTCFSLLYTYGLLH